jgi:hypothetical protein
MPGIAPMHIAPSSIPIPGHFDFDDIDSEDVDLKNHQLEVKALMQSAYRASQNNLLELKKRLIEEKDVALSEALRKNLSEKDEFQEEIASLQAHIQALELRNNNTESSYVTLCTRASSAVAVKRARYAAEFSLRRVFSAWSAEVRNSRASVKLDRVGKRCSCAPVLLLCSLLLCCYPDRCAHLTYIQYNPHN